MAKVDFSRLPDRKRGGSDLAGLPDKKQDLGVQNIGRNNIVHKANSSNMVLDFLKGIAGETSEALQRGGTNLLAGGAGLVGQASRVLPGDQSQNPQKFSDFIRNRSGEFDFQSPDSLAGKIGGGVGEVAGFIAEQAPSLIAGAKAAQLAGRGLAATGLLQSGTRVAAVGAGAVEGAAATQGATLASQGQFASLGDTAIGAGIGGSLGLALRPLTASQAKDKANKLATEILQPREKEITTALARGRQPKSVDALVNNITKSKSLTQLKQSLVKVSDKIFGKRAKIFSKDNFAIADDYVDDLVSKIDDSNSSGLQSPSRIRRMQEVFDREVQFVQSNGGSITREMAQSRKQAIDKLIQPLLKKQEAGTLALDEASEQAALNAVRFGLKKSIEGGDEAVSAINSQYSGLKRAVELLASREGKAQKEITGSLLQKLVAPLVEAVSGATGAGSAAFTARLAAKQNRNLLSLTRELEKLATISKGGKTFFMKVATAVRGGLTSAPVRVKQELQQLSQE